jgi:hypothetical protein
MSALGGRQFATGPANESAHEYSNRHGPPVGSTRHIANRLPWLRDANPM